MEHAGEMNFELEEICSDMATKTTDGKERAFMFVAIILHRLQLQTLKLMHEMASAPVPVAAKQAFVEDAINAHIDNASTLSWAARTYLGLPKEVVLELVDSVQDLCEMRGFN